ncbi:DUF5690 family protein [Luteolibacter flavescens]|uniref:DUF5690 family protein n=1 Tax=Luteolibacter flavescens TaxID=1859460 RepID=A0ABT3FNF6_9BACT|nr:DUF5690 family protein [Luteolibacter flavescens]MCW1884781.1 DUF5690 family protein [Luteolibacter flavescens]
MYAFRRPFAAAGYVDAPLQVAIAGRIIEAKTLFLIAQVFGYCVSKFAGVKVCSELPRARLGLALVACIVTSWLALLAFAVLPAGWKPVALFLNGMPLGVVWGLVVRYLEGRKVSELLLAALSCSYILASGEVKRVGAWLLEKGVDEYWMPFATGAMFVLPFVISVGLLSLLPPPSAEDEMLRAKRQVMGRGERLAFARRFLPGLVILCVFYLFLTAYRDFRDSYQADLFVEMGIMDAAAFSRTERPVAFGVMILLALAFLVKGARRGLATVYLLMMAGMVVLGGSTMLFSAGLIGGETWMMVSGFGAYLTYVPFGSVLFDRIIAATRFTGTAVFAIYLADALGYSGSVGMMIYRDIFAGEISRLEFFRDFSLWLAMGGLPLLFTASVYFLGRAKQAPGM